MDNATTSKKGIVRHVAKALSSVSDGDAVLEVTQNLASLAHGSRRISVG